MFSVILGFLILNALFWSFFPHNAHCKFLFDLNKVFGSSLTCPQHWVHLVMGLLFYLAALYYSQMEYINDKLF